MGGFNGQARRDRGAAISFAPIVGNAEAAMPEPGIAWNRAIAPSETGAFSLPSPPTRARPGPFPPTPPRATDHAHDNTVRMTTAATPTRRRRVRPAPIRAHGSNAAFNAKSAKTPRKMRSPMRFSLTVNKHPSKQVPLGHVLIGSTEMGAPDLR